MGTAEPSSFTRGRIASLVDRALRESGALGVLPTPLDAVTATAALELVEAPGLPSDVLGAIWFEERTVFVDGTQSEPRRRFTQAHEIVHALCGWHYAALREDTEASLFGPARDAIEAEANAGAAMLIFQAEAFRELAAGLPCSLASVRRLAETFGASLPPSSPLRAVVEEARTANGVTAVLGTGPVPLEVEAQYNRHAFLVLARPHARP